MARVSGHARNYHQALRLGLRAGLRQSGEAHFVSAFAALKRRSFTPPGREDKSRAELKGNPGLSSFEAVGDFL